MTLVSFTKIAPALAGFFALSAVCDYAVAHQKVFGGRPLSDMRTMTPAWKEAEKARFMNMEREGAPDDPIVVNPLRHNLPASIRNAGDLPSLDG